MITWALLFTARVNYNDFLQRNCDPIYFDRSSRIQRIERINDLRNPKSTSIVIIRPIYTVGQKNMQLVILSYSMTYVCRLSIAHCLE